MTKPPTMKASATGTGWNRCAFTALPNSSPMPASPAIAPETSNGWMLILGAVFFLMVCALGAIGLWYFFLR